MTVRYIPVHLPELIALAAFICGFILGGASVLSIASVWPSYPGDGMDKEAVNG